MAWLAQIAKGFFLTFAKCHWFCNHWRRGSGKPSLLICVYYWIFHNSRCVLFASYVFCFICSVCFHCFLVVYFLLKWDRTWCCMVWFWWNRSVWYHWFDRWPVETHVISANGETINTIPRVWPTLG